MTYIINNTAITLILSNHKTIRVEKTDRKYPKVLKTFELPADEQEDAILRIFEPEPEITIEEAIKDQVGFTFVTDEYGDQSARYNGRILPNALVQKVLSIVRDGLPLDHFAKFWENLELNPSQSSVDELVDFLEYKELPITEDGHFIAYKGIRNDYYSDHGNLDTVVLQGTVNEDGRIFNGVGETIEVLRRCVNDNRNMGCSTGLHVGSLNYARGFAAKMVIVKINPKDVVSVPTDSNHQKCRVSRYEVLSDYVEEIQSSVVDEQGEDTLVTNDGAERDAFTARLDLYLARKKELGADQVTIRQIQNSFSPDWPTRESVLEALQTLVKSWSDEDGVLWVDLN